MPVKKVGTLIKEARSAADLTQEQLARKIKGLSANDISLAERGQKDLTQTQLKEIAKATGVTQASLLNAAKGASTKSTTVKKASVEKKTTTEKKTTAKKTTTEKKTSSSGAKTTSVKVTAAEKKLLELYRAADSETKKSAVKLLKGDDDAATESILEDILGVVQSMLSEK